MSIKTRSSLKISGALTKLFSLLQQWKMQFHRKTRRKNIRVWNEFFNEMHKKKTQANT